MNNNIEEVYEHSIIPSIINKNGWILDLGCVNFKFYNHMLQYTNNVVCVDANPNIEDVPEGCEFINSAVVPNNDIKEIILLTSYAGDKPSFSLRSINPSIIVS